MAQRTNTDPRLFVLMRPGIDHAMVLRQGPSKVFCSLGWDLATDEVTVGQWVKHKIYVERCDLSSTGKYLVYFALNGQWDSETAGAWTAVSLAPHLKALKLWAQGDTWGGGGMFYSDRSVAPAHIADRWNDLEAFDGDRLVFRYFVADRFIRDGWRPTSDENVAATKRINDVSVLHTSLDIPGRYSLIEGEAREPRPSWTWADVDTKRERLLWAERGVLYQAAISANDIGDPQPIFDARPLQFEAIAAPYKSKTIIVPR